jgi:hypothetical protein
MFFIGCDSECGFRPTDGKKARENREPYSKITGFVPNFTT